MRVEDTDEKRSSKEAIDAILQGLDWLGLKSDGDFVLQSKNFKRHQEIAQKLLEKNQAYLCYTSAEELSEMRKNAEMKKENFHFKSPWRDKFNSQTSTVKPVIRIKAPLEGETVINDLVQGEVRVKNSELDDLVMLRGDGTATYMLAVVVDDFDMKITHIIRGDDHLNNAFRQKVIYDAMGWEVPKFAHIPLIHGSDGAKMSKRHGATSVIEYKDMGYLPEAMRNYLLRLGFGLGEEIISDSDAAKIFDITKVGKGPARFDFAKLNHVNKFYIKGKSDEELFDLVKEFFEREISGEEKNRVVKALRFLREKPSTLREIADAARVYFDFAHAVIPAEAVIQAHSSQMPMGSRMRGDDSVGGKLSNISLPLVIPVQAGIHPSFQPDLVTVFQNLSDWSHDGIKNAINEYAASKGLKIKDFGPALRVALTFSSGSAGGIFDVVEVLGKDEVLKRLGVGVV